VKIALARREFGTGGGAELYLQRLIGVLLKERHEVTLITGDMETRMRGVKVRYVSLSGSRSAQVMQYDRGTRHMLKDLSVDCLFSLERLSRQDVLRAGDGVHATWLEQRRRYSSSWRRWLVGRGGFHRAMLELEKRAYDSNRTRRVIVNSEMVGRDMQERFDFPAERIHLVRNGVETERWRSGDRAATRARWGIKKDEFLLLFAGSGWERKGLRYVLETLAILRGENVKLVVAGKDKRPLGTLTDVIFAGSMSDMENAYAAADLMVFPPIYEPSANVVFEALAAGLPVVTSGFNGAAEVIEEGVNGTVIEDPSDVPALAQAVHEWMGRGIVRPVPVKADLSLKRNMRETLEVLTLAAEERAEELS